MLSAAPRPTVWKARLNILGTIMYFVVPMEDKMLNFTVLIEQDEDGVYVVKVPDIAGCYTQGRTVEQAMERIKEAIQVCLEADKDDFVSPMKFIGVQQLEVKA